jgi:signal transduction histidine kinase
MGEMRSPGVSGAGSFSGTPLGRLVVLSGLAGFVFLSMAVVALQPAAGWTWSPMEWRNPAAIDPAVWSSLATGLLACLVSAWVWALKPSDPAATLFAMSGVATLLFCFSSFAPALALPLPEGTVAWFWIVNMLGASAFGIIMICLFLIYPSSLPQWRILAFATVIGFGAWTLLRTFGPWRDFAEVQRITTVEMLIIAVTVIVQVRASSVDPRQMAIATWLGASTLIGAGAFISTVALPLTFGAAPLVRENYAFAFFLIIYGGLATGLMRYRLFDMGAWAYRLVFYALALVLLIGLDLLLIAILSMGQAQALGVSLLLVGFAYLPLRERLWRSLTSGRPKSDELLFQQVLGVSFKPTSAERTQAWKELLKAHFRPLEMTDEHVGTTEPSIAEEGLVLRVPAAGDLPALTLKYNNQGRSLFSTRDVNSVQHLALLATQARDSRSAYDRGVFEERTRIARDLHDNIGAQLMRALHSAAPDKKDAMIRDTLADLRDVINHAHESELALDEMLADLRAETADRLDPHGVTLIWALQADAGIRLASASVHALRSVIREAASNTIKHADATCLKVEADALKDRIRVVIEDNGKGFDVHTVGRGQGLSNMKARVDGVGGDFLLERGVTGGGRLVASFPIQKVRK